MKLLFVGNQLVAESWFITFEVDWASKYTGVSTAWFSAISVLGGVVGLPSLSVTFLAGQELTMWIA